MLVYFVLNGALTFWIWGVERGKVFVGEIEHRDTGRNTVCGVFGGEGKEVMADECGRYRWLRA